MTVIVLIAAVIASTGCSGGDGDGDDAGKATLPPASTATVVTSTTEPFGEQADEQARSELLGVLSTAFSALRSGPVKVEFEMDEQGTPSVAEIRVDHQRGLVDAAWIQTTSTGTEITTLDVVVDGVAYLKSTASAAAAEVIDFIEVDERSRDTLLDNVFTAYGRLGPSLDRMLVLLERVPFRIATTETGNIERVTVSLATVDVVAFLEATGLERTGSSLPDAAVVWTFLIDGTRLIGIEASGTQFHNGEALAVTADIRYTSIDPFDLEPPPVGP